VYRQAVLGFGECELLPGLATKRRLVIALTALLLVSCGYSAAVMIAVWRYRSSIAVRPAASETVRPAISILKPAGGASSNFIDNLRSHARQDYPLFEILVGVSDGEDQTREAVAQVQHEFSNRRIEAVLCDPPPQAINPKVAVLEQLAKRAANAVWVINDADVEVPHGYLDAIADELAMQDVELVTCLYDALPGALAASVLESIWISAEFPGQVLLARSTQGMKFALGATMAFRRDCFDGLGGFSAVKQFIGDDYALGEKFSVGHRVSLCPATVTTHLPASSFADVFRHQLRWSRTIRAQRPGGHLGLGLTFGSVWAVGALFVSPVSFWPLPLTALVLRGFAAESSSRAVGHRLAPTHYLLLPLVDICALLVWLASFFSNEVTWAGKKFRLGPKGRIVP
jgi:ceramide glucosyltransferase